MSGTLSAAAHEEEVCDITNLHPIQLLRPPENETQYSGDSVYGARIVWPPYRFPYTPSAVSGFSLNSNQRSGRNTSVSDSICHGSYGMSWKGSNDCGWSRTCCIPAGKQILDPAWMGNTLYIFPDAPIAGFEGGRRRLTSAFL